MEISSFQPSDPYAVDPMCGHRDKQQQILESGMDVTPFVISLGDTPIVGDPPIQFLGEIYQEIQWEGIDSEGRQVAELVIVKFHMNATHPTFGEIDITFDHTRPGTIAGLRAVNPGAKYPVVHTTRLHVVATVKLEPGLVLQNAGPPLTFISEELSTWPPQQNIYSLATQVPFEVRKRKGEVFMTSNAGSAIVDSLSM